MRMERAKSKDHPFSACRVVAMVITVGCHLVLLMVLLRPAAPRTDLSVGLESEDAALKVRFISLPRQTFTPPLSSVPRLVAPPPIVPREVSVKERLPLPVQRPTHVAPRPPEADSTNANASPPPVAPDQQTNNQIPTRDGAFRDQIFNAQRSREIRGVPGSDRPVAPGIALTNSMDQGIGSVMRSTQRLFGVTNRHCIDVEVWQHLTPDELKARNLSAADVERESEKYDCNRPLGLNF